MKITTNKVSAKFHTN